MPRRINGWKDGEARFESILDLFMAGYSATQIAEIKNMDYAEVMRWIGQSVDNEVERERRMG